jgi:tetratricopeptide (TPR) repeat protein
MPKPPPGRGAGGRKPTGRKPSAAKKSTTNKPSFKKSGDARTTGGPRKAAGTKKTGSFRSGGPRKASGSSYKKAGGSRKAGTKRTSQDRRTDRRTDRRPTDRRPTDRQRRDEPPSEEGPKEWGSLARRGAGRVKDGGPAQASEAWREAVEDALGAPPTQQQQDEWIRVDEPEDVRRAASGAVKRGSRKRPEPSVEVDADEVASAAQGASHIPRLGARLNDAAKAFERERFTDAQRILRPLAERAPRSAPVRELYGLTLYRLGKWKLAVAQLDAFTRLTNSTEQHPVLADCERALGHYDRVEELWDELKAASPSAELVTEGRIVAAGALADQNRIDDALRLLEQGMRRPKRLQPHHLRLLYALADLTERSGDTPKARELFTRVRDTDPDFADVDARLRALR